VEALRRLVSRGLGCLAARELPASQVDSCVRDVLDRVVRGIQSGDLDDPVRLVQYVRLHLAARIREIWDKQMPMRAAAGLRSAADARRKIMRDVLLGLTPGERQSLVRFYVEGHDDRQICRELGVPAAEFQSLRARVKVRFQELCQQGGAGRSAPAKRQRGLRSLASGRATPA
jgi:DNA-binding NarL/FixJ family response regulator